MNYFEGNEFFLLLFVVLLIGFVLNHFGKRKDYYILSLSILFAGAIYGKSKSMVVYLLAFIIYQYVLVFIAQRMDLKRLKPLVMLSILPLVVNKVFAITQLHLLAFIGISYMSFKTIQIMLEISDGLIKERISVKDYLQFLLFFPTISSGPIDRSRRFLKEINEVMPRKDYLELAGDGIYRIVLGLLYKVVLSTYVYQILLALSNTGTVVYSIKYMYLYTLYLFFDFAGYSLMAVGSSNVLGIQTPMNFNQPFLSIDIKDFWTRWHITLSTWLRDFVFSRVLMQVIRKKWFKNRLHNAAYAYMGDRSESRFLVTDYFFFGLSQPCTCFCGTRVVTSSSCLTSVRMVDPAPMVAPLSMVTGATSWLSEPINTLSPMMVLNLLAPL